MGGKSAIIMPDVQRNLEIVGKQIKLARLRRNLSAELVAERAGISCTTLRAVEKGIPTVAMGTYAAVLHALHGMDTDLRLIAKDELLDQRYKENNVPVPIRAKRRSKSKW